MVPGGWEPGRYGLLGLLRQVGWEERMNALYILIVRNLKPISFFWGSCTGKKRNLYAEWWGEGNTGAEVLQLINIRR